MTVLKIAGGIVLGFVVLIVGCSALVAAGSGEMLGGNAITLAEYRFVETGETKKTEIIKDFGEPTSSDEMESSDIEDIPDSGFELDCVYYDGDPDWETTYQFCFDTGGTVESRSKF
jgi:hypothetical protein